jgi:hypothetical protein
MKKKASLAAPILALALASAGFAVTLTFDDTYDGRAALGTTYTTKCIENGPGHTPGCSQTDWALNQWNPLAACGTASGNCYLSPHQAHYADYNRSAALVNADGSPPTSHLEVSVDITTEENPDDSDTPGEGYCVDPTKGRYCWDNLNAGLVLNSLDTNLTDFVMCKIEVNADTIDDPGAKPNGLIQVTDWQGGTPANPARKTDFTSFGTSNPLRVNGTTYHLVFYRVADGNPHGTYYCTVSGPSPFTSVTISWAPPAGTLTYDAGTYAGVRAKVAEDASDQEDSGATRFDNFEYKVH